MAWPDGTTLRMSTGTTASAGPGILPPGPPSAYCSSYSSKDDIWAVFDEDSYCDVDLPANSLSTASIAGSNCRRNLLSLTPTSDGR